MNNELTWINRLIILQFKEMSFWEKLKESVGLGPGIDYPELMQRRAQIIDVRTPEEYRQGHIKDSVNIPLNVLPNQISRIRKDTPVITCCRSGMRSATAKNVLEDNGFTEVYNGGGWSSLQRKIKH